MACVVVLAWSAFGSGSAHADSAQNLANKYSSLSERLAQNQFMRPVVLDSAETPNQVTGEIYAVIDHPFAAVSKGLINPDHWCDVMSLHINTKYCRAVPGPDGTLLRVNIGKKTPEKLADAPRVEFKYAAIEATPSYFDIRLSAREGPMGTSDFRIELEAVAISSSKTFLHLTYSYAMNFAARLAMQTYLATVGSGKVGFTQIAKAGDGQPNYIAGMRGLVERNTMRYYLAIDSFLGAVAQPPGAQLDKRLQSWFSAVEQYPRQLHELDRAAYLSMKHDEYLRQKTVQD
jgi:hypothetical protein